MSADAVKKERRAKIRAPEVCDLHEHHVDQVNEKLLDEIESLEDRFDRHLEIYKNNGVESKRVADALVVMQESIAGMLANSEACGLKVFEMHAKYIAEKTIEENDAGRMQRVMRWGGTISAGIVIAGALTMMIRYMLGI